MKKDGLVCFHPSSKKETTMAELMTSPPRATGRRTGWMWALALGVVLLLLGLASVGATTLLELTSLLIFGPLLLTSSILQVFIAFLAEEGKERLLHLASAVLEAALGFLLLARPILLADLVIVIAAFLLVIGLVRMARSLVTRSSGQAWAIMSGGAALILGICVSLQVPVTGLWFVGPCLALDFICHGISWAAVGLTEGRTPYESLP
jgi:uncharacterized membrane protein HdeD (DUF308 family)